MGLTLEQARELRESTWLAQKAARKPRVNEIVERSLSVEEVEKKLRDAITENPTANYISVVVLHTVTNDWDASDRKLLISEVYDELKKKYTHPFYGAELEDLNMGNQAMAFKLSMRL
jgi:hypothetical protein